MYDFQISWNQLGRSCYLAPPEMRNKFINICCFVMRIIFKIKEHFIKYMNIYTHNIHYIILQVADKLDMYSVMENGRSRRYM